jgi:hypothetical protein
VSAGRGLLFLVEPTFGFLCVFPPWVQGKFELNELNHLIHPGLCINHMLKRLIFPLSKEDYLSAIATLRCNKARTR